MGLPVFAYGTLMSRSERKRTLPNDPMVIKARLDNYERVLVPGLGGYRWINIILPKDGSHVDGVLMMGLDEWDMQKLDGREGVGADVYRRKRVSVTTELNAEPIRVYSYVPGPGLIKTHLQRLQAQGKLPKEWRVPAARTPAEGGAPDDAAVRYAVRNWRQDQAREIARRGYMSTPQRVQVRV